ncbi:MAG TPA: hypothetical protein VMQ67_08975, partial [Candidatus Saccharimonadales bacterium]|nr:hypothetical protein [Candidatus Saccharimonadales bacterium]
MNRIEFQQNGASELHSERQATLPASDRETIFASTRTHSSRRNRIAGTVIALLIVGGLIVGFLPRWHQRRTATADMNQLAMPTVSVVSPSP